jgi:hypothetical protein
MFTVSSRHTFALGSKAEYDFHVAALAHIRENFPTQTARHSDDSLIAIIRGAQATGEDSGLVTEGQVMCLIDSTILLGPGFMKAPEYVWAEDPRKTADIDPNEKAVRILKQACDYHRLRAQKVNNRV